MLATGDGAGAIKLWNAQSGEGLRTITEGESVGAGIRASAAANYLNSRKQNERLV